MVDFVVETKVVWSTWQRIIQERLAKIMYWIHVFFLRSILFVFQSIPEQLAMTIGKSLGLFWFHVVRYRRNLVFNNLELALGREKTNQELYCIARDNFIHYGLNLVEFLRLPSFSDHDFQRTINIRNTRSIEQALKKGKGVILILGHYGNWDMAAIAQARAGFDCHIITKKASKKSVDDFWQGIREDMGVQFLPSEGSAFKILKLLKKNNIVVMIFDQRMRGKKGIQVNFFKRPALTMRAVSLITMKTGSPVIPVFIWRDKGIHIYESGPEIPLIHGASEEETMRLTTQKYNDVLEAFVRKHPEQWLWIHERWKL